MEPNASRTQRLGQKITAAVSGFGIDSCFARRKKEKNYATHKHPAVQRWLERHPRFHVHFTPTSASWLNMVERFFRDLTVKRLGGASSAM